MYSKGEFNMNLFQLELLCEIARTKSFSKAAKLLHMSQPAVSSQIQALENFYGTSLFNRSSSGVTLNEYGELVWKYAKEILKLNDELEKEIDKMMDTQKLLVGASSSIGGYALPCGVFAYQEKYPQVDIKMEIHNSQKILQMLIDDEIHLALVEESFIEKLNGFQTQQIFDDELLVISPYKKPWLNKSSISIDELKKAPLIIREKGSGIREAFEERLMEKGLTLSDFNVKSEMSSINAIKSTVEAGLGLSVSSRIAVQKELRTGIIHGMIIEDFPMAISYLVVYKNKQTLSGAAKKFIRLVSGQAAFC